MVYAISLLRILKGDRYGLGLVAGDRGGHLVLFTGVAPAETGGAGLNESILLGQGRKAEIR
jgi:hypothetical protein